MNILLTLFLLSLSGHANTSLYSSYKFGAYSMSNFYLDLGMDRYNFAIGLEKRFDDYGLQSMTLSIDSVMNHYQLILGKKPYFISGPLSSTIDLWGLTLKGKSGDFFVGRTKDPMYSLPPSFTENKYTIGGRYLKNIGYHVPLELNFIRKSDYQNMSGILNNNSLGTNIKMNLGDNFLLNSQVSTSISDVGFGSALGIDASYTTQRYGSQAYFRKILNNYVTPTNFMVQSGNWFRSYSYQKPADWIGFSQDFAYSSLNDMGLGLNTTVTKSALPVLAYGINFAPGGISQSVNAGYEYRKFSIASGYYWARDQNDFAVSISRAINNYQIWTTAQVSKSRIFQFGGVFPFSSNIKLKGSLSVTKQNGHTVRSTGLELSLKLPQNFYLNTCYDLTNYNTATDHFLSVNLSNSIVFEEIGFGFISGKVYMDQNNNGFFDREDEVAPDIEVVLDGIRKATTNKDGDYSFSFIKKGEHKLYLNLGCLPAEVGSEKRKYAVNTNFLKKTRADFALEELGIIEGVLFYDENANGAKGDDEPGVPNVVIQVNGSLTTTDQNGKYRIANLVPGTYVMQMKILPPETMLATPEYIYINLKSGEKFINRPLGVIKKERPVNKQIFGESRP